MANGRKSINIQKKPLSSNKTFDGELIIKMPIADDGKETRDQ